MKYSKEEKAGLLASDGMIPTDDPKRIYSTFSEQKTYPVVIKVRQLNGVPHLVLSRRHGDGHEFRFYITKLEAVHFLSQLQTFVSSEVIEA